MKVPEVPELWVEAGILFQVAGAETDRQKRNVVRSQKRREAGAGL